MRDTYMENKPWPVPFTACDREVVVYIHWVTETERSLTTKLASWPFLEPIMAMMPTLSSLMAPDVVMTTPVVANENKVGEMEIMPNLSSLMSPEVIVMTTCGGSVTTKVGIKTTRVSPVVLSLLDSWNLHHLLCTLSSVMTNKQASQPDWKQNIVNLTTLLSLVTS